MECRLDIVSNVWNENDFLKEFIQQVISENLQIERENKQYKIKNRANNSNLPQNRRGFLQSASRK